MDIRSFIILSCLIPGAMALDEGLSGLIVAGVIAGVLLIVGIISVTIWCFVRNRVYDDDKESLDIISPKQTSRYNRFPATMKFRSFAPTSTRPRPPVTFFTVRDSPRSGGNLLPVTGAPYLFQPRGPVMYADEGGISARSSVKDRESHYRRPAKSNGHVGSMKIRELQSGDEMMNFESSDDENGNKRKTVDNRSRSKSRDKKYVKNPDHKSHHRHKPTNHTGHRSRSNSRGRNKSVESRNSVNSNTISAQPGDIILNPVSIFDSQLQPPPVAHNISQTTRPEPIFVPVMTRNPISQTLPTSSAFQPYTRDEDPPVETPREDYLTPRSVSEMPSTIQPESSRSDYITPSADYPRKQDFTYPHRPSSNDPFISPRPPTPEFDADSILYSTQGQVTTINRKSPTGHVFESTPRTETPPVAPPPPPMPVVEGSTESGHYLSAVHRPPTPPPGKLLPVTTPVENILNSASSSAASSTKRPTNMGASPHHNAMMAEIKNRRQRRPSSEDIGLPPPSPSSGESTSLGRFGLNNDSPIHFGRFNDSPVPSFRRQNDSPVPSFRRQNDSPVPSFRRQNDSPLISDARRPSNVQFAADPPEIIPSGLSPDSPDNGSMTYEPGSVNAAFDAVMSSGVPSSAPAPPAPPPPPPLPSGR